MLSCEYYEIFKNSYFEEDLQAVASDLERVASETNLDNCFSLKYTWDIFLIQLGIPESLDQLFLKFTLCFFTTIFRSSRYLIYMNFW